MKIKLTKKWGKYPKDTDLQVDRQTGKEIIAKGFAIEKDFVTLQEKIAVKEGYDKAVERIEKMPERAQDLVGIFPTISNTVLLQEYLEDTRITVSKAAAKRISEL